MFISVEKASSPIFIFVMYVGLLAVVESKGQVVNDDIEARLELELNVPRISNTTDCTLEWNCLNHALTKKIIQYHNDQWFFFKTTNPGPYFINISKQECRELRGVQLIVILGKPCEPESYKIIARASLGDHNGVYDKIPKV